MLSSVSQGRAIAGARAFTTVRPRVAPRIANGSVVTMAKSKAYMVEVEVGEDEPEDVAVRRYMKLVMQSRVVEKLRARKTKETKIEEYKRRFRERVEARKAGIVEPTFDELYTAEAVARPFEDFYQARDDQDPEGPYDGITAADDIFGSFSGGGYVDNWSASTYPASGSSSTTSWQGGYM
ncbi:hypothetical protein GPECTOR_25g346 [Gonium pectorale]|uniref:Plastid ribosomal protein S21 n=1 Tax=Gonium pectorale TaxID=33097 RepID=A0A150GG00_GONPE|nr:hypothetical protein GPECTOR_25g346 [Gonium pectorale]|eukprot:KXZ48762.1 hypothetical protein GPECTOR_25g346 [Gonium pectorale]